MRVKSEPVAIGVLVAVYLLLCAMLVVNSGCASASASPISPAKPTFDPSTMNVYAVQIDTECGRGSGVLVDSMHVVTAHHVIDCDTRDHKVRLAKLVTVTTLDGTTQTAAFDALDEARDLARLRLEKAIAGSPLTVAHASVGEIVCAVTVVPERAVKCDTRVAGADRYYGDLDMRHANVWFGNSGSPLFDSYGNLVGVVTRMRFCNPADELLYHLVGLRSDSCGGVGSSIDDSPVAP